MTSSARAYRVSFVAACTLAAGAFTTAVLADQILVNDSSTLTSYLMTSKSNEQDVRPQVSQRGVHIDGTLRAPPLLPIALAGNPFGESWNSNSMLSGIRLDTGTFQISDVDLALPAPGFSWVVGRTFNSRQKDSGGSYFASNGFQGYNWFQTSAPEIKLFEGASDDLDIMYLIYGADRFAEFKRKTNSGSSNFAGVNGAAGAFSFAAGASTEPDTYTYTDQRGYQFVFFSFDNDSGVAKGQLWKITDPAGNMAYVGDSTTGSTAISGGFNGSGWATTVYQTLAASATRRFTYDYTSGRLDSVTVAEKPSGGSYTNTGAKVEYTYYGSESYGDSGDLKLVTITTPLTDSGVTLVQNKYYRYYEDSYHADTNPGYQHQILYVYDFDGVRQYDWLDSSLADTLTDLNAASNDALKAYASAFFKYDTERRVKSAWFNGACGCSGGVSGEHTITYDSNTQYSDSSGYDSSASEWLSRTCVIMPSFESSSDPNDANDLELRTWQYFDEAGQPLHRVMSASSSPDESNARVFQVVRNSDGQLTSIGTPENLEDYVHTIGGSWIVDSKENADSGSSLVTEFTRISTGNAKGFIEYSKHKKGIDGTAYYDGLLAYTTRDLKIGDVNLSRPFATSSTVYPQEIDSGSTGALATSMSYTFHDDTAPPNNTSVLYIAPKVVTTTPPAVTTSNNGPNSAVATDAAIRQDGTTAFIRSGGIYAYTQFTNGMLVKQVQDAGLLSSYPSGDSPSDYFTLSLPEEEFVLEWTTTYAFDAQGRSDTTTSPGGRVLKNYYSKLKDGRMVTLNYSDFDSGTPKFYGPVQYTVSNLAGRAEILAVVTLTNNESTTALTGHIDETDADPITAMDLGTVAQMSASHHDETGQLLESSRVYFSIPANYASSADGTHYDATTFGYDDAGHMRRTEDATGTIQRTFFTLFGQVDKQYIGTNDSDWAGGDVGGTNNMTDVSTDTYTSNFLPSQHTQNGISGGSGYTVGQSGDDGVVTNTMDHRGRVIIKENMHAPHELYKYDNMNRVTTVGYYSSVSGLTIASDPTSVTSNRVGRVDYAYDELGRVWKTTRHKINSSGSSTDSVDTSHWFDPWGRMIKTDGSELSKTRHDRIGRVTHQFDMAQDNDSTYAHLWALAGDGVTYQTDAAGDIVLEEHRTVYDTSDGNVIMTAVISRFHSDYGGGETTGALDTNADGDTLMFTAADLEGRIQITANWYDRFDRLTETVSYGTNGGSTFDRDGLSVPARSDTALLTEYEFNTDGTLLEVADPKNLKTRYEYDAMGRQTLVINNYVNGEPSSLTADDDALTRYVYTDGMMTKLWVDIYPKDTNGSVDAEDEVTEYTYGVSKYVSDPPDLSTYSLIASGRLLQKVVYPMQSGGQAEADRRVQYNYGIQGQQMWMKDATGTIIQTDYSYGRVSHRRATTLGSGIDGDVERISYTYDNLSRRSTVTQYDDPTPGSGSVVDEVKYSYDEWGPISKIEQDHDSAVGGGGVGDYEISFSYVKNTTGSNVVIYDDITMPTGLAVSVESKNTSGHYNLSSGRTDGLNYNGTTVVTYDYIGHADVAGTTLNQASVMSKQFTSTPGDYADRDRFNRITTNRWTKDLATDRDLFNLTIAYDRNSNITRTEDNVFTAGKDVAYTMDNLNRLTDAQWGIWGGSSIGTEVRQRTWTLDQVGNWRYDKLDLENDNDYNGAGERNEDRTHNLPNELLGRDTDDNGTDNYTLTYNKRGDLTDDNQTYKYEYDAFGRLVRVKNQRATPVVVSEYRYNGLGHRIGWHYDMDASGGAPDGSDPWLHFVYDEQWRIVATYRGSDSSPKEQFVYHHAGRAGPGESSSYIDAVVLRDRDMTNGWAGAADGTLEERTYYCQNWRADVVALVTSGGAQIQQTRYGEYGEAFGLPQGDTDGDGDVNSGDTVDSDQIQTWINGSAYDVRGDLDLDGDVDSTDKTAAIAMAGTVLGWGNMSLAVSASAGGNRHGYSGYENDGVLEAAMIYHVRHRVYHAGLGRWVSRDHSEYADGNNLYQYCKSNVLAFRDASGLLCDPIPWVDCRNPSAFRCALNCVGCAAVIGGLIGVCSVGWQACLAAILTGGGLEILQQIVGIGSCCECIKCLKCTTPAYAWPPQVPRVAAEARQGLGDRLSEISETWQEDLYTSPPVPRSPIPLSP